MKTLLAIALLLTATVTANAGCPEKRSRSPQFVELAVPEGSPRPTSVEDFRFIGDETTIEQMTAKIGPPDAADGERTPVFVYCMPDGSEIRVGSRDGVAIDYVRRDGHEVFKRNKKKQ